MALALADTNVLVYFVDDSEPDKQARAQTLLYERRAEVVISTQVLIELHSVCTSRLRLDRSAAAEAVRRFGAFPVVGTDRDMVVEAAELAERAQLSIFDALIVRAAQRAGCETLLSEDFQHGQDFDGVVVENPFR